MKTLFCAVLFVYVLSLNIDSGSALRCYSCFSKTGQRANCEINVSNKTADVIQCSRGYTACMTLTMDRNITRACSVSNVCQLYRNSTGFKRCSTCVTDLCNGSTPTTSLSMPLGLFAILLTIGKITVY